LAGVLVLFATATATTRARADGYFSGTSGARAAGRGGAFTAKADDLSAVIHNPAGLARVSGTVVQGGNRFSHNSHTFTREATLDWGDVEGGVPPYVEFSAVDNERPWQLLEPLIGAASSLGLQDWGFALSVHAPAGIGREEYPVDGGQRYMMVSREALILSYAASAAWNSGELFGVGASLQWLHLPSLRYQLVIDGTQFPGEVNPVASELDMLATIDGSDPFALNAVVGAWYRPVPYLELAVSGQIIPSALEAQSTLAVDPLSPSIDEEVVLRRDGERANDVVLSLPLPVTAQLGVRYRHLQGTRELFDVELDVGYASWSRVQRFAIEGDGLVANLLGQRVDLGEIAIAKRWRDTFSVRVGGDYALLTPRPASGLAPAVILRGGVFYESALAERGFAHVDFVSGTQLGGALGVSLFVLGVEVAVAHQYRHQPALRASEGEAGVFQQAPASQCEAPFSDTDACHPQYLGQPAPAINAGTYSAHSHATSLDLLYRF
jgi:long-subunit fatty acid transport protein